MKHLKLNNCIYFITTNTQNQEKCFINEETCKILLCFMNHFRKQFEFLIYGYVIMPDHFHLLIDIDQNNSISKIMGHLKGRTGYEINKLLERKGEFWQENYYDHIIRNQLDFKEKINYIHENPYKAGLVEKLENYKYSSYINYYLGDNSLIKIDYPIFNVIIGFDYSL